MPKQQITACEITIAAYTPLPSHPVSDLMPWMFGGSKTHYTCPEVAEKLWPDDPMDAAAITCTAHPQSIDAIDAMDPIVFAYPTIHASRFRQRGEDRECVQKYSCTVSDQLRKNRQLIARNVLHQTLALRWRVPPWPSQRGG